MNESQVFTNALKITSPAERDAYLDQACAGAPELRAGVEALLRAHDRNPGFLEQPAGLAEGTASEQMADGSPQPGPNVREEPGLVLAGRYKLIEVIGEGGMGTVWMAQQTEPVKRLVAVKLIKAGLGSKTVLARFEAERQALALMDHPNIAKVLDAGTAPDGTPFFAMDLVKGIPITRYCDEFRLTPRQRLELFVPVCEAVQHAHQKGIIHRDLKPSNVLVAQYDERPVPKVIDFGVAKATGQALTEQSLYTGYGTVVGTVEYMSPEQASFNQLDVDTRSDIYSLGVLLYELLTGSPPFSRKELERAGMLEMLKVIREKEPTRPSAKLSTADGLPTLAANRGTEPKRLTAVVRGELDWITMKALDKDRSCRYGTASALAADVRHYLADEPVQACPPSAWYRFRKFARRHRVALLAGVLVCAAIVLGAGGIVWAAWDRAARQARVVESIGQFLDRADQLYRDGRLQEALAEAEKAQGLLNAGADHPQLRDQVHQWLADLAMATRLDESQLAPSDSNFNAFHATAYSQAFRDYGIDLKSMPPAEVATRISASRIQADLVTALDDWSIRTLEDPDPATQAFRRRLHEIVQIADSDPWRQSCRRAADAKDSQKLGALAASADIARARPASLAALGAYLRTTGDLKRAIAFLRAAQRTHPANVSIMLELSTCLQRLRPMRWDDALGFQRAILTARPSSPAAHVQLGRTLDMMRRADEAIGSFREALRLKPDYVPAHYNLGDLLLYRKHDAQGALAEFSQGLAVAPDNVSVRLRRANAYVELGQREKALADLAQCIKLQPNRALVWWSRGHVLLRLGRPDQALADFAQAIQLEPGCLQAWTGRGSAYLSLKQYAKAIVACSEAIKFKPDSGPAYRICGSAYAAQGQWDKAASDFSRLIQMSHGADVGALLARVHCYEMLGQAAKALADYTSVLREDSGRAEVWLRRGQLYGGLGQTKQALADFSKAIELDPRSAAWNPRGRYYAEMGRWKEAVADLEHVRAGEPEQPAYWYDLAMANLGAGDKRAYGILCTNMRQHFRAASNPAVAANVVSTCVVAPEGVADPGDVLALAKRAASIKNAGNTGLLGAAFYRAGQPGKAVECFEQKPHLTPRAWDWLFRAMAHQRLRQAKQARQCLDHAKEWIAAAGKTRVGQAKAARVPWFNWQEEVAVRALRTQAEAMINNTAKPREMATEK